MHLRRSLLVPFVGLVTATFLLPVAAQPAAAASTYAANCPAYLRTSPATSASSVALVQTGSTVTASGSVAGGVWSASCPGAVSGSTWLAITAVNGRSVSTMYGTATLYAASGLFRTGGYLEGVDVSTYQGSVNWSAVAASGRAFAVMRSSLGSTYVDPTYATNHAGARAAGMAVAAYHYATPSADPADPVNEANWFVQHAALAVGDVIPALDIEQSGGLAVSALQGWVEAWLDQVYALTGIRPMIYTSPSFWSNGLGGTAQFANEGYSVLWIAHWGAVTPIVPAGNWGGHGWTFWQYDNCGGVPGISGCVDLDRYNGLDISAVMIRSLTDPSGAPPPTPTPVMPPPALSSIAPSGVTAGSGGLSLSVVGSSFVAGSSSVRWNGSPLTTTFLSSSQLTATVPATLTGAAGTATISVVDTQTGASSGSVPFTVSQAATTVTLSASSTAIVVGQSTTTSVATAPPATGRSVTLQRMGAGESGWSTVASATTDATGAAAFTVTPVTNMQYQAILGDAGSVAAVQSAPIRVLVRSTLSLTPTSGGRVTSLRWGTSRTFIGTASPVGPGILPQKITFSFYRYIGGRWVFLTKRDAWADSEGRAHYTWTFNWRGQWYVRATANSTATNANSFGSNIERYTIY